MRAWSSWRSSTFASFTEGSTEEEITVRQEEDGQVIATRTQSIKNPDGTVTKVLKVDKMRQNANGKKLIKQYVHEEYI